MSDPLARLKQAAGQGRLAEVLAGTVAAAPDDIEGQLLRAEAAMETGADAIAAQCLAHVLAREPDQTRALALSCRAHFLAGDWDKAWPAFAIRFRLMDQPPDVFITGADGNRRAAQRWDGTAPPRDLVAMAEQGLGDTIQFAPFLNRLPAQVRVTLVAPRRLFWILARMVPRARLMALEEPGSLPLGAQWCALCDLPRLLHLKPQHYAISPPPLAPEPARVAHWRARLPRGGLRLGLAWEGNPAHNANPIRSAALDDFLPLLDVSGVTLVSLQRGAEPGALFTRHPRFIDLAPELSEADDAFRDSAAVLAALDGLISVDTGIAHAAGVMGVPTRLLLTRYYADWRWGRDGRRSLWYPRHILMRQSAHRRWLEPVAEIATACSSGQF